MTKILAFLNKYGIVFHSLSIIFWLWILWEAYDKQSNSRSPEKPALAIPVVFLGLSIFNFYNWFRKRRIQD